MVAAPARSGHGAQPHRLLRPPDELRRGTACRPSSTPPTTRPAPPAAAGLIITEEHSTHPTDWPYEKLIHGFHRDVIPGYRRITDAVHRHRRADLRPDQPQRRPGVVDVHPAAGVGAVAGRRPAVPRGAQGGRPRPRSPRSSPATPTVAEHCAEGGFDGIELQCSPLVDRARLPLAGHQPAHRRLRRAPREPGPAAARDRRRRARASSATGLALGVRLCGDELIDGGTTIDEAVEVARMVEATGQVDYINTSIGVATATLFMIEASMHVPPGYALFIPSAHPQGGRPARRRRRPVQGPAAGRAGAGRGPLRPRRRRARPDRRRRLRRQGPRRRHRRDPAVPVVQPGVRRADGPQPLARLHREPAHRPRGAHVGARPTPIGRDAEARRWSSAPGPAGLQAAIAARPQRPPRHRPRARRRSRRPGAAGGHACPNRAELGDMVRNQVTECRRLGVDDRVRRRASTARAGRRARGPTTSSSPPAPSRPARGGSPRRRGQRRATSATCSTGTRRARPASSCVIDEIGFHHATSVAELLADRGCAVEVVTPGMVVGQDLGITLDMENWWIRADGQGHRADAPTSCRWASTAAHAQRCCTTRPASTQHAHARLGRARRARPTRPSGCTSTCRRGRRRPSSGSATASPRAGPTPRSSRASGSGAAL